MDIEAARLAIDEKYRAKIDAARVASQERREAAFIDVPFIVAGKVPLRAMCLPDFLALIAAGNAHVTGTRPAEGEDLVSFVRAHNALFMWTLSTGFSPDKSAREAFIKRVAKLPFSNVCEDLGEYLRDTFADAPRAAKAEGATPAANTAPIGVSFAAIWVHRLASKLHWSRAEIRATPLKEMFQLMRVLDAEDNIAAGRRPAGLTSEVDALWSEYLAEVNTLNATAPNEFRPHCCLTRH